MNNLEKREKLKNQKLSVKPFVYIRPSISIISIKFLVLLGLQILMLLLTKSYNAFFVVLFSVFGACLAGLLTKLIYNNQLYELMATIIQGIFIGLLLPENYPVAIVCFISFLTLFISRTVVFKNINSWINVSILAVIIAWIIGKKYFPGFDITTDIVPLRNSSVYLIQNGVFPINSIDSYVTQFLNNTIFSLFKISIPEGYISILMDTHSVIPAFRFNLLTIVSSIVIFSDNSFSGIIPSIFLFVYLLLVRLFGPFMFGGILNQGDILLALLSSGTIFGAVFLIQWFGTIPVSVAGKIVLGFISGLLAFFIIGCGTSPIGMVYTILITNVFSMIIRVFEEKNNLLITAKVVNKLIAKGENK